MNTRGLLIFAACSLSACTSSSPSVQDRSAVYGTDDRADVHEHPSEYFAAIATSSVAALVTSSTLPALLTPSSHDSLPKFGAAGNYCPSEPFVGQPVAAYCSAVLIADDLILTAGHCVTARGCSGNRVVFNYAYSDPNGELGVSADDVFSCSDVLVHRVPDGLGDGTFDYAIVRLDRKATPRFTPVRVVDPNFELQTGEPVVTISATSGLPLKIDSEGVVSDARSKDYFNFHGDTFGGSSGGPIFTEDGRVVGIVVRGQKDFAYDREASCTRSYVVTSGSEDASYARSAINDGCESGALLGTNLCLVAGLPGEEDPGPVVNPGNPEDPDPNHNPPSDGTDPIGGEEPIDPNDPGTRDPDPEIPPSANESAANCQSAGSGVIGVWISLMGLGLILRRRDSKFA